MAFVVGFLPWIVYWVLVGNVPFQLAVLVAVPVSGLALLVGRLRHLPGRTLDTGTLVVFVVLAVLAFVVPDDVLSAGCSRWAAGLLRVLAGLAVGRPFVLDYATPTVDAVTARTDGFRAITTAMTWLWAGLFALMTLLSAIPPIVDGSATSWIHRHPVDPLLLGGAVRAARAGRRPRRAFPPWFASRSAEVDARSAGEPTPVAQRAPPPERPMGWRSTSPPTGATTSPVEAPRRARRPTGPSSSRSRAPTSSAARGAPARRCPPARTVSWTRTGSPPPAALGPRDGDAPILGDALRRRTSPGRSHALAVRAARRAVAGHGACPLGRALRDAHRPAAHGRSRRADRDRAPRWPRRPPLAPRRRGRGRAGRGGVLRRLGGRVGPPGRSRRRWPRGAWWRSRPRGSPRRTREGVAEGRWSGPRTDLPPATSVDPARVGARLSRGPEGVLAAAAAGLVHPTALVLVSPSSVTWQAIGGGGEVPGTASWTLAAPRCPGSPSRRGADDAARAQRVTSGATPPPTGRPSSDCARPTTGCAGHG